MTDLSARLSTHELTRDEVEAAGQAWGANCGPTALAAILGMSLDAVRPHLDGFDAKRYTNPTMMFGALKSLGQPFVVERDGDWPSYGLARVQWEGPWTKPGVPMRVRYRHTHWVGAKLIGSQRWIWDVNCICVGGWVVLEEWTDQVVPWLLKEVEPKADGRWHVSHAVEVTP